MPPESPDPELVTRLRTAGCVFAEEEAALLQAEEVSPEQREAMVVRRLAGEPLELILGWAEFSGLRVGVAPGVFVPRQRSALLVDIAADAARSALERTPGSTPRGLDLCCGTGAIGAALSARVEGVEVWAVDVDPAAVECARGNLPSGRVLLGDLFEPLPDGLTFDVVVANAPYVPTDRIAQMPPEARDHEHLVALDGGTDGLDVQRRVIEQAPRHLAPGGVLVIESSQEQAPTTAAEMRAHGLATEIRRDDDRDATAVTGTAS